MFSVSRIFAPPIKVFRRRMVPVPKSSMLDAPPPPVTIDADPCFGDYCIKATVEQTGKNPKTYIGYSQNMEIVLKTKQVCERLKGKGDQCSDPEMTFKGGKCDEVIFVRSVDGTLKMIR